MENPFEVKSFNNIACSKFIFFIHKSKLSLIYSLFLIIIVKKNSRKNFEIKFKCPVNGCDNTYTLKNKLLAHLRTHYGIKPYKCQYCLKSFNDKGNLKTHLRVHTGERPYKCSICFKAFKTEGQLKEHLGSHCKDKPFQCPYCLKFYKRKGVVKNHMLIHYRDPSFKEKKEFYKKIVDNLDNKNIFNVFEFSNKNTNISSIFSTKDESFSNSLINKEIKPNKNIINDLTINSDLLNINNTDIDSYEYNNKIYEKTYEIGKDEDNKDDTSNNGKKEYNNVLFNEILNKNEEEIYKDDIEKKFEFKINENENIEEHSIFLQHVKIENKVDTILLEDIL